MATAGLLDDIYQAAVIPAEWGQVLDALARIADAEGTLLFAAAPAEPRWRCSARIQPLMQDFFNSSWAANNSRGRLLVPRREPRFLTDFDAQTLEELDRDPYYRDYLRPLGFGWVVGTTIRAPTNDTLVFSIERSFDRGPVEPEFVAKLDAVRPHLARAALLSARIGLERAQATVDTLELLGLPAAVLRSRGQVIVANEPIRHMQAQLEARPGTAVSFRDRTSERLFGHCLGQDAGEGHSPPGHSFAVPGRGEAPPFVAHVLPVRGAARDIFIDARWVLFLTPVAHRPGLSTDILQALYDFTPAEARLVSHLLAGKSLAEAALANGNSEQTLRRHLKSVFAKAGVHRQSELMRLFADPVGRITI